MFTFRFAISKPLVFSILGLFYYVLSVPASTDPKDLPKSLKPNPGPPVPPGTKNTGWPGISQWTSLGDSYATGVGAGDLLGMNRCVHYSDAYPLLINNDSRMPGQANGRRIWDCTCSGATTQNILDNQFLDKPRNDVLYGHRSEFGVPQIATLTAGGDDVGFLWLILYCILQIFPYNPCEKQIQRSREILQGDKFYNSLDLIIKQILIRGITAAGDGFKLFVTGYAQFFNEKTDQCDKATFSYWDPEGKNSRMLDKGLRQELNQLAKDLNSKIKAVVDNNRAWGVENVDYDAQFEGHRFCEDGVTEPDNDNPKIWFFHLNSEGNGRTQSLDDLLAAKLDPNGNKDAFYADIKKRSSTQWTGDLKPQTEDDAYTFLLSIGDGKDVKIKSALSSTIRIFHPTRPGLDTIVSQIFGAFPKWPPADQPVNRQSTQPANPIPPPMCTPPKGNLPFSQTDGVNAINKFCGEKQYWDKQIVAPVSMTDAVNKGIGVTDSFDVGGGNKLWLQLSFAEDGGCVGYFAFTVGANDNEKLKHCTDRFMPILDGVSTIPFPHHPSPSVLRSFKSILDTIVSCRADSNRFAVR